MRLFTMAMTALVFIGMTVLALANPSMLPKHPGYPSGGEFANDTGQQNLSYSQSILDAATSGDTNMVPTVTESNDGSLTVSVDQNKGSLAKAERDLLTSLQPEIAKGHVTVQQSGDQLTINLSSHALFESGRDTVKPAGVDILKRIGAVLKDFPEKQVQVDGHTDNLAIRGALLKKFPNNQALSKSRAVNAMQILGQGGVSSTKLDSIGYGDTKPVASNDSEAGRQKNRRVEILVS